MTHYIKSGAIFTVSAEGALDIRNVLPPETFTVKLNERSGEFYLELIEGFTLSGKIYGNTLAMADRVISTFQSRTASTGVMLDGEKGSGKTLLAKKISMDAAKLGIPTIVINQPWVGEEFNAFIQSIQQEAVIIFDEFEKVYDALKQEKLLTLLDGVYPSKKLFIITCNDKWRVNEHMRNRPGRIYYRLSYRGLERSFIEEYCQDNLENKGHITDLVRLSVLFSEFNFDILKAMVEEMNRYGESPQEVMTVLNAKPEQSESTVYDYVLKMGGKTLGTESLYESKAEWKGNPLNKGISISYWGKDEDGDREYRQAVFTVADLKEVNSETGKFLFVNKKGDEITLSKAVQITYNQHVLV